MGVVRAALLERSRKAALDSVVIETFNILATQCKEGSLLPAHLAAVLTGNNRAWVSAQELKIGLVTHREYSVLQNYAASVASLCLQDAALSARNNNLSYKLSHNQKREPCSARKGTVTHNPLGALSEDFFYMLNENFPEPEGMPECAIGDYEHPLEILRGLAQEIV